ncbi:hypothetical protein OOZ19_08715 [Saccharopolyspora sp. NFXS83]|uniref:hypothetical protein n=1 Tax=Saccharopolyspora sp. NFXS83 TaxID=2993560 RepID=UPI00224B82B6|nr:hypothetical protein [Saccharopolyspora sp. NFXS83]MCX2730320.1 hypothetical protein [Saccharopolyspora sp. NFXS83]
MDAWFPWWATTIGVAAVVLGWDFFRARRNPGARAPVQWWLGQLGVTAALGAAFAHGGSGAEFLAEWAASWSRCLDLVVLLAVGAVAVAETLKWHVVLLAVGCALVLRAVLTFSTGGGRWPVAVFGAAVLGAGWWWFRRAEHPDPSAPAAPAPWLVLSGAGVAGAVFALSAGRASPELGAALCCAAVPALLGARAAFGFVNRALHRMPAIVPAALLACIGAKAVLVGVLAPAGAGLQLAVLTALTAGAVLALGALTTVRTRIDQAPRGEGGPARA